METSIYASNFYKTVATAWYVGLLSLGYPCDERGGWRHPLNALLKFVVQKASQFFEVFPSRGEIMAAINVITNQAH